MQVSQAVGFGEGYQNGWGTSAHVHQRRHPFFTRNSSCGDSIFQPVEESWQRDSGYVFRLPDPFNRVSHRIDAGHGQGRLHFRSVISAVARGAYMMPCRIMEALRDEVRIDPRLNTWQAKDNVMKGASNVIPVFSPPILSNSPLSLWVFDERSYLEAARSHRAYQMTSTSRHLGPTAPEMPSL